MSSITLRDGYHNVDWEGDFIRKHPEVVNLPRWAWVIEHDAEANAEKHFEQLAQDVRNNRRGKIEELALPAGGNFDITSRVEEQLKSKPLQARL